MKHLFKSIFAIAAAAMTIASCVKEEPFQNDNSQKVDMVTFEVNADSDPTTKTHLAGKTAIRWNQTGEEITVLEYTGKTKTVGTAQNQKTVDDFAYANSSKATVSAHGETATFTVTLPEDKVSTSFDYWGIYPALNFVESSDLIQNFKVDLPEVQNSKAETFDPNADLLISSPVHQESQPAEALSFRFHRPISVVEMTLVGITEGEKISSVSFSNSTAALAGRSYYDLKTNQYKEIGYTNQHKTEITINCADRAATGKDVIYFTTFPATLNDVAIVVNTDKATYSYSKESLAKPIILQEGHKFPLTVTNFTRKENVTDEFELWQGTPLIAGLKVIFASGTNGEVKAMGGQNVNHYRDLAPVTVADNKITNLSSTVSVFTLVDATNGFGLENNGKYLSSKVVNKNDLNEETSITPAATWKFTLEEETKNFSAQVMSGTSRPIRYNASSSRYATYEKMSSCDDIFVFVHDSRKSLESPKNVKATLITDTNSANVTWEQVSGAASYTVSTGSTKITVNAPQLSTKVENLKWGVSNTISVIANPEPISSEFKSSLPTSTEVVVGENPNAPQTYLEDFSTISTIQNYVEINNQRGDACVWSGTAVCSTYGSGYRPKEAKGSLALQAKKGILVSELLNGGISDMSLSLGSKDAASVNIIILDENDMQIFSQTIENKSKKGYTNFNLSINKTGNYKIKIENPSTKGYAVISRLNWSIAK